MVRYWIVIILLAILICYNLICAYRDYRTDKDVMKFISRIILLLVLVVVILNSLFRILDVGFEIPLIF